MYIDVSPRRIDHAANSVLESLENSLIILANYNDATQSIGIYISGNLLVPIFRDHKIRISWKVRPCNFFS